jgi:pSer/pThr/pTyr-binding forkhead associated (FHA) protein
MAFLKMLSGSEEGRRFDIDRDETTIGRAADSAFVIDDPSVSGRHCKITRRGRRFNLSDLGSTNGTQLNEVLIEEHQLSAGDVCTVGSVQVLFDGDDIDNFKPVPTPEGQPQVTVKLPPTETGRNTPAAFNTRKRSRWTGILLVILGAIAILAAMALFLSRLFAK